MKKIIFITALLSLVVANALTSMAQVNYSVKFNWDDSNCHCNEPVTMKGKIIIREYPGGTLVDETVWFTMTSNPWTYNGYASGLRDCVDEHPCYTVYVFVAYTDNTGVCCSGSDSANTTGESLFETFYFPNTIILN
ncbi:MAG: hypothetical protein K0B37_10300 [Bacteroidales bacterium]|nr:hypothetical protein [Bacteroidales bacterium]